MSYNWFNSVLEALGKRVNFESISNMYGRTCFEPKASQEIQNIILAANPLQKGNGKPNTGVMGLMGKIKIIETDSKEAQAKAIKDKLGDISWAEGLF